MVLLLRAGALVSMFTSLLVITSIGIGQTTDAIIVTGNMMIESHIYTIYVEDLTHRRRVYLAGTRCFEGLPSWVYSDGDAAPVVPPTLDPGTFFAEPAKNVMEVLAQCRPS